VSLDSFWFETRAVPKLCSTESFRSERPGTCRSRLVLDDIGIRALAEPGGHVDLRVR
jgi:hypothetical protein